MSTRTLVFVGALTRDTPFFEPARGRGLSVFSFDEATGALDLISETIGADNPTYIAVDPQQRFVCATSEVFEWHEGVVTGYVVDPATGRLLYRNKQVTLGHLSAFVSLDRARKNLLVSNYSMQSADTEPGRALVILPVDGAWIAPASDSVTREGSGPVADRQERSHPHSFAEMPDGRLVMVDLGSDQIAFYGFDSASGRMSPAPVESVMLPSGSGPRHLVWSVDGFRLYVVNELASTIAVLGRLDENRPFELVQIVSTLPPGFIGENRAAGIAICPDGKFVYASNRGHDSLMSFRVESASGLLTPVGAYPSGGRIPRSFDIDPTGRFVIVANQGSDNLTVLAINSADGSLSDAGNQIQMGTPMCVKIVQFADT